MMTNSKITDVLSPGERKLEPRGYSFIELLVVSTVLMILASAVIPLTKITLQREREVELRRSLREIRIAIDRYKDAVDLGIVRSPAAHEDSQGYPQNLETLVEGVNLLDQMEGEKRKFMRRIPIDPMTGGTDWGLRSYQDDRNSNAWGGQNVYDVHTKAMGKGLDGTNYRDW